MIRSLRPQISNRSSNNKRYSRGWGHHKLPTARLTRSLVVQFRPKIGLASKINQSCGIQRSSRRSLIQPSRGAKAIRGRGHARRCPFPITRHPLSQRGCPRSSECNLRFTRFIFEVVDEFVIEKLDVRIWDRSMKRLKPVAFGTSLDGWFMFCLKEKRMINKKSYIKNSKGIILIYY